MVQLGRRFPDHAALAKLLAQVAEDEHLAVINSQFKGIEVGERFIILSEAEITKRYGLEGREQTVEVHAVTSDPKGCTKAVGRFGENVEPSAWQILDRDMDEHTQAEFAATDFEAWLGQVDKLLPGVVGVDRVRAFDIQPCAFERSPCRGRQWAYLDSPEQSAGRGAHPAIASHPGYGRRGVMVEAALQPENR